MKNTQLLRDENPNKKKSYLFADSKIKHQLKTIDYNGDGERLTTDLPSVIQF